MNRKEIFVIIVSCAAIVVGFLFALNGRYEKTNQYLWYFDKWRGRIIEVPEPEEDETEHYSEAKESQSRNTSASSKEPRKDSSVVSSDIQHNRKWLYDALTGRGANLGTYEQYEAALSEKSNLDWLYDAAQKTRINVGTREQLYAALAGSVSRENRRKKLYDLLRDNGVDAGDYNEYYKAMDDPARRRKFYDLVTSSGIDLGGWEYFEEAMTHPEQLQPSSPCRPSEEE